MSITFLLRQKLLPHKNNKPVSAGSPCAYRFFNWWRRGESNPCPKASPSGFLRVQTVFSDSRSEAPADRLSGTVFPNTFGRPGNSHRTLTTD